MPQPLRLQFSAPQAASLLAEGPEVLATLVASCMAAIERKQAAGAFTAQFAADPNLN